MTYEEFAGREGDIVTGIIQQDSAPVHAARPGQGRGAAAAGRTGPVRAVPPRRAAEGVHRRGPQDHQGPADRRVADPPGAAAALFELEVPEIAEGIVEIKAVAREPGHRSKIAVTSHEPGVDPVGACVGAKGSRVRMVVNELRGEKIDVVQWTDDLPKFVANALAAGQGQGGSGRPGDHDGRGHRARLPAVARDRQGGPERPPRGEADRLPGRHPERDAGERGGAGPAAGAAPSPRPQPEAEPAAAAEEAAAPEPAPTSPWSRAGGEPPPRRRRPRPTADAMDDRAATRRRSPPTRLRRAGDGAARRSPQRTCVGCRAIRPEGRPAPRRDAARTGGRGRSDGTGARAGRVRAPGRRRACAAAFRRGGLARALRTALAGARAASLRRDDRGGTQA